MFFLGCPMWGYKEWVGNFFPPRTPPAHFLRIYSQKLNTVEGNTIFYSLPSVETITRWRQETPPTFRICPKVLRSISHEGALEDKRDETLYFVKRIRGLETRLGPAFLQLPPSFSPAHLSQLEAFLHYWPTDMQLAVEVRHPSFYTEQNALTLNTLLRAHKVARVMMDTRPIRTGSTEEQEVLQARERKPDLPLQITVTTDFTLLRYIGHPRMEVNEPLLDEWSQHIGQWLTQGMTVYAFCHCPFEVHSPDICYELYQRLSHLTNLPRLSWPKKAGAHGSEETFEQGTLF
ncbi:MAG TPA: DUF72 domain-containing protein [Ktedonobacteraceae bacterium]